MFFFVEYEYIDEAIAREKCIKRWKRDWKIRLIEERNSDWKDLYFDIGGEEFDKEMKLINNKSKKS